MSDTRAQIVRQIAAWREIRASIAARCAITGCSWKTETRRCEHYLHSLEGQLGDYDRIHPAREEDMGTSAELTDDDLTGHELTLVNALMEKD